MSLRIALTHHNPDVLIMDIGDQVSELVCDVRYEAAMGLEDYLGQYGTIEEMACMVLAIIYGDDYEFSGPKLNKSDLELQPPKIHDNMTVGESRIITRNWKLSVPRSAFCARLYDEVMQEIELAIPANKKPVHVAVHHHTLVLVFADLDFKEKVDAALEEIKADFMSLADKKPKRPWNSIGNNSTKKPSRFTTWAKGVEGKD